MKKNTTSAMILSVIMTLLLVSGTAGCGKPAKTTQGTGTVTGSTAAPSTGVKSPAGQWIDITQQSRSEAALLIDDLSQIVKFTEDDRLAVLSVIEGVDTVYQYSGLFMLDKALERYRSLPAFDNSRELILLSERPISAQRLLETARRNNEAYFSEKHMEANTPLDDEYIAWICEVIADTLNLEFQNYDFSTEVLYDLEYTLQNMCIFKGFSPALATIDFYGNLTANPSFISGQPGISGLEYAEEMTISHEVEHLIQRASQVKRDALGVERLYGFCFIDPWLEVSSLSFHWLTEASAERLAADLYGGITTMYSSMVGYLDALSLSQIFKEDMHIQAVPRLSQERSLDAAFSLFNCDTLKDQMEWLNMMYAIEIIQQEPEGFIKLYEREVLGAESTDDDIYELKIRLKEGICSTMSRYFYSNLTDRLTGSGITLEELFLIIAIWEADLNLHLSYDDESRYPLIGKFMGDYCAIQAEFFRHVSGSLDIPQEDIVDCFEVYAAQINVPRRGPLYFDEYDDFAFPWLDSAKNGFLTLFFGKVIGNKTVSVRQMVEVYKESA